MSEIQPEKTERSGKYEPLWIQRMDACLTDQFRYQLNEARIYTQWADVGHGEWSDPIKFFEYLDRQVQIVYDCKEKPSQLRAHLDCVNPSSHPYPQGGLARQVAIDELPILRQQIFLLNALSIIVKKRCKTDENLLIVSTVLTDLLHRKISHVLRNIGTTSENDDWYSLANLVDRKSTISEKALEIALFLGQVIDKNNLKDEGDTRDPILFMREQLETPYFVITRNNNQIVNAFADNWKLHCTCATLYYEFHRLSALARLEHFDHKSPLQSENSIVENDENEAEGQQASLRRRGLALLCLAFGRPEIPVELVAKRVEEVFHPLLGGNRKNLYDFLRNPTYNTGSTRSIKKLCDDLHFVRDGLGKLGLSNQIVNAISEIDFLIDDLNDKKGEK